MILKHEITWDGVAIILALVASVILVTRLQDKAEAADTAVQIVSAHQVVQDDHTAKLDTAIVLLSEIVAERTGKPVEIPNTQIK